MRLCLLGDPVAHSLSPAIHTAALTACGLQGEYTARRVGAVGFAAAIAEIRVGALDGANVTMPHKSAAHATCDAWSSEAERSGAVNTLALRDGHLMGWNTDVLGLRRLLGDLPRAPVLVLGAGGAAAAALLAVGPGARVAARRGAAAAAIAARLEATPHPWGVPLTGATVINATPLGMHGEPLPGGVVREASALVDLAYGPAPTPAVRMAAEHGIAVVDGQAVLVAQAADAFEIWTGMPAPVEVMAAAARTRSG